VGAEGAEFGATTPNARCKFAWNKVIAPRAVAPAVIATMINPFDPKAIMLGKETIAAVRTDRRMEYRPPFRITPATVLKCAVVDQDRNKIFQLTAQLHHAGLPDNEKKLSKIKWLGGTS
jgi:hypothetical protein